MMTRKTLLPHLLAALLSASLLAVPAPSYAEISQSEAVKIAKAQHGGKVLKVRKVKKDGKTQYVIKLLLDGGRVKTVTIKG